MPYAQFQAVGCLIAVLGLGHLVRALFTMGRPPLLKTDKLGEQVEGDNKNVIQITIPQ